MAEMHSWPIAHAFVCGYPFSMLAAFTDTYGPADILTVRETAAPSVGAHDVLIEVHASPVTAGDRRLRAADFPAPTRLMGRLMFGLSRPRQPVQGTMFAGVVVAVGEQVTRYAVGERVFGSAPNGAYAQQLAMHEDAPMAKIPAGLGFAEAAAMPYGLGTALHMFELAGLKRGDSLLILGGSGGVGRYALQLAKHLGAEVTVSASASKHAFMRELGADHMLDYRTQDFRAQGQRYDLIFDIADSSSFRDSRGSLREGGRYMSLSMSLRLLWDQAFNGLRSTKALFDIAMPDRAAIEHMAALIEAGAVRAQIAERYPLSEIVAAHRAAERRPHGDVIVEPVAPQVRVVPRAA